MAKSGQIVLPAGVVPGDMPLADSVVFTESTPTSIGGAVSDLLDKATDEVVVAVRSQQRHIAVYPSGTNAADLVAGTAKLIGTITRDDPTRKSSPVTMADGSDLTGQAALIALKDAIDSYFAAQKPTKTASAIINNVEDAIAGLLAQDPSVDPGNIVVVLSQAGDGAIEVYYSTTLDETAATAKLDQVLPTSTTSTSQAWE